MSYFDTYEYITAMMELDDIDRANGLTVPDRRWCGSTFHGYDCGCWRFWPGER